MKLGIGMLFTVAAVALSAAPAQAQVSSVLWPVSDCDSVNFVEYCHTTLPGPVQCSTVSEFDLSYSKTDAVCTAPLVTYSERVEEDQASRGARPTENTNEVEVAGVPAGCRRYDEGAYEPPEGAERSNTTCWVGDVVVPVF